VSKAAAKGSPRPGAGGAGNAGGAAKRHYDLIVVGAGPGGYVAAIRAAQLGFSCAVVEKDASLGGTCLNIGCIPSKALLDSSELYARIRDAEAMRGRGIRLAGAELDLPAMLAHKQRVVDKLTGGVATLFQANGVERYHGTARLAGPKSVEVRLEGRGRTVTLSADAILLATGSVPARLPIFPEGEEGFITSTEALSLAEVPKRLAVIGGGAIGLELGSVWSRLGAEVTVVELMGQILPGMDAQSARLLQRSLERQGLAIHTGSQVSGYRRKGQTILLEAAGPDKKPLEIPADRVLVAVGRRPFSEGLGLEEAGVALEPRGGRVAVNEYFQTSVPSIYAIGDLIRGPMLAHKAEDEGVAVVELLAGLPGEVNYEAIPAVVYTWPEVASVGKTEEQLKTQGVDYARGSFPFRVNGRALAIDSPEGSVKILADRSTDRVLGAHIVGPWASDLIAEIVAVVEFGGSAEDIARTMHAHPTLPEAVREAALDVDGRAIHLGPKKRAKAG
jgi:dihydrolipoamide dehydrogenase